MLPLPEPYLAVDKVLTPFLYPRSKNYPLTESWDNGGVNLSDPSESLTKYAWKGWTDGNTIFMQREGLTEVHTVLTDVDITEIDITFDQNMRPCVAYVSQGITKLRWYDTETAGLITTSFPADVTRPRVSLDDKRRFATSDSDILFVYQKNNSLYYRIQRERYSIEHFLTTDKVKRFLWRIGMGKFNRFLIFWR